MKWIENIVNEILAKYSNEKEYVCACGISTTGIAHVGNFRELIITYLVSKELINRGKKVRLILSFDDFDRLKKVPINVDKCFEKYVGMPNYSIPSPNNGDLSYAEYYENIVISELAKLGIKMEFIRQSEKYLNRSYDDYIRLALDKKDNIYDIVSSHKTQELSSDDKEKYYPVKIYCSNCNKDTTHVENYENGLISYSCSCGNKETSRIENLKIKLKFNIDWPMRWNYENVCFEPCGKGHADNNSALPISKEINHKVLHGREPVILPYEFFYLKNNGGRMNKSSSDLITISNLLDIMPKEMVLWMFLARNPKKEMFFSIESDIMTFYQRFEQLIASSDEESVRIKNLIGINYSYNVKFSDLIKYLPIVNYDIQKLKKYIPYDDNDIVTLQKIKYAINWLKKYQKDNGYTLLDKPNNAFFNTLWFESVKIINKFREIIKKDDYQEELDGFLQELRENNQIKEFYRIFYKLVFNTNKGMPVKRVLENFPKDKIVRLLTKEQLLLTKETNILHLSDLHFDINDPSDYLINKWERMVDLLKKNVPNINYFVLSGDIICFYNMHDNFEMAYRYLVYLADELKIDPSKIMICTGNHEMIALRDIDLNTFWKQDFNKDIYPIISEYSDFLQRMTGHGINSIEDLYSLRVFEDCDFMVINSLFGFTNDQNDLFFQDEETIKRIIDGYQKCDKARFLITHAGKKYNPSLFKSGIKDVFKTVLCGHKHEDIESCTLEKNSDIELISGNTDGFVEETNDYHLYSVRDKIQVKRIGYNNNWFIE